MVIWSFYWFIYLIFKLLSNLKIMKNRRHCHFKLCYMYFRISWHIISVFILMNRHAYLFYFNSALLWTIFRKVIRTIGPSDYWNFALLDRRTIYKAFGLLGFRAFVLSDRHPQATVMDPLLFFHLHQRPTRSNNIKSPTFCLWRSPVQSHQVDRRCYLRA
jgi:hypothetical protein